MTVDGITHVTLPVSDLEASTQFYETVLEASPVGPPDGDASIESAERYWFRVATGQYIVLSVDTSPTGGAESNGRGPMLSFQTEESDLVGLRARLDALGHDYSESTTALTFSDPDDNRLEVTTDVEPP
jgi:catechol 2,3-dioxygenase-like lactoylglutathione lyase family enzyme